ncbi:MAG: NIPSNAP family protein, partial [Planctomycetales bacterium]
MMTRLLTAAAVSLLELSTLATAAGPVLELRTHTCNEGKLPSLHARFRDHTMRIFASHGMTNVIYWTPAGDKPSDTLVYLIAHDSRDAAKKSWAAFRKDPAWKKAYKESIADGKIVKKVQSVFLDPTKYSPKQWTTPDAKKSDEPLVFEMRTYVCNDGKLDGLHARFRDHTMKLFEKHGIVNAFYSTPADEGKD